LGLSINPIRIHLPTKMILQKSSTIKIWNIYNNNINNKYKFLKIKHTKFVRVLQPTPLRRDFVLEIVTKMVKKILAEIWNPVIKY
jgi:predicted P-loop ATPase/GTPase